MNNPDSNVTPASVVSCYMSLGLRVSNKDKLFFTRVALIFLSITSSRICFNSFCALSRSYKITIEKK